MTPEALIAWAEEKQRVMYGYALQAGNRNDEEACQYFLGQRDAFGSLIRHLKSPTLHMDIPA